MGTVAKDGRGPAKSVEVELRRRTGEGFGFVIASQEVANGGWFLLTSSRASRVPLVPLLRLYAEGAELSVFIS